MVSSNPGRCDCLHRSQEYFFDPEVLNEGEVAPNDRCCRICGRIGHFMKDCPMRKKWELLNTCLPFLCFLFGAWAQCVKLHVHILIWIILDPGPSTIGIQKEGRRTCETEWTKEMTLDSSTNTRMSTGGREMYRRCEAATCVDQLPTSRRTVICTEALQVRKMFGSYLLFLSHIIYENTRHNKLFSIAALNGACCCLLNFCLSFSGNMKMESFPSPSSGHLRNLREKQVWFQFCDYQLGICIFLCTVIVDTGADSKAHRYNLASDYLPFLSRVRPYKKRKRRESSKMWY